MKKKKQNIKNLKKGQKSKKFHKILIPFWNALEIKFQKETKTYQKFKKYLNPKKVPQLQKSTKNEKMKNKAKKVHRT